MAVRSRSAVLPFAASFLHERHWRKSVRFMFNVGVCSTGVRRVAMGKAKGWSSLPRVFVILILISVMGKYYIMILFQPKSPHV